MKKKKRKKNTGWGGGEEMQRQGTLGASGGKKEEERKGNEGGVRGWMDGVVERGKTESGIDQGKEGEAYFVDTAVFPLLLSFSSALPFLRDTLPPPSADRAR